MRRIDHAKSNALVNLMCLVEIEVASAGYIEDAELMRKMPRA